MSRWAVRFKLSKPRGIAAFPDGRVRSKKGGSSIVVHLALASFLSFLRGGPFNSGREQILFKEGHFEGIGFLRASGQCSERDQNRRPLRR